YRHLVEHRTTLLFVNTRSQSEMLFQALWTINDDNLPVDIGNGISGGMAGPGNVLFGRQDRDIGFGAAFDDDEAGMMLATLFLADQPFLQIH
ncbi:hypothetical protein ACC731_37600, partial [Rhizobium ruizarguesonis]